MDLLDYVLVCKAFCRVSYVIIKCNVFSDVICAFDIDVGNNDNDDFKRG